MALKTATPQQSEGSTLRIGPDGLVTVIWIDWYAYHVARFRALSEHPQLRGRVCGIEMVGGIGVHRGLKFREPIPASLPVHTVFADGNWRQMSKWKIAQGLWRQLNRQNPSTILVPGYYNIPALAAAVWGRLHRRQTILMTESTEGDHARRSFVEGFKSLLIRSLFSGAIAGGKPHRRYLEKLGFKSRRIGLWYDVVDNRFFREEAAHNRQRHTAADYRLPSTYFLFVGRLAEEKNVNGLLQAYLEYRRGGGTWSLVLVGDGPAREALQETAKASPYCQDIHFEGLRTSTELSPYYAFAGCFVLPSTREPWGLVVNEAMASGLPVIITRQCGCAEDLLESGANGFAFDACNTGQLAILLGRIASLSASARAEMGRQSLRIISRYSPEAWAEQVARLASRSFS